MADTNVVLLMMEQFYQLNSYPFDRYHSERNLVEFIREPALGRLWLIEAQNRPLGYIVLAFGYSFEFMGRNALLDELYLEEAWRGRGIGSRAMDYIREQATLSGIKTLHLEVEKCNGRGLELYTSKGFKTRDRHIMSLPLQEVL